MTAAEQAYLDRVAGSAAAEGAYAHLHGAKPQTLAYALRDSPVDLAAWIAEKFRTWSDCDCDGDVDVERAFGVGALLAAAVLTDIGAKPAAMTIIDTALVILRRSMFIVVPLSWR